LENASHELLYHKVGAGRFRRRCIESGREVEGFGVLTEIDVANTLKQKLGVEMKRYRILGACNPGFAHKALSVEDKIGVMLPCNVVIQEKDGGEVDIAAIDPRVAMKAVGNPALAEIAEEVAERLSRVVSAI
jgi:uncharacterized protein (DUF302 family)